MNRLDFLKSAVCGVGLIPIAFKTKGDETEIITGKELEKVIGKGNGKQGKRKEPKYDYYGDYIRTSSRRTKKMKDDLKKQMHETWRLLGLSKQDVKDRVVSVRFIWKTRSPMGTSNPLELYNTLGWICKIKKGGCVI